MAVVPPGEEVPPVSELTAELIQFGVLGVIVFLMLFGWLWPKPSVEQLKIDKAKAEADRDELIKLYQTEVIPVLTHLNQVSLPLLSKLQADMHDMQVRQEQQDKSA